MYLVAAIAHLTAGNAYRVVPTISLFANCGRLKGI